MEDSANNPTSPTSAHFNANPIQSAFGEPPLSQESARLTQPERVKQIWAIGGGKGGVGKSLISSCIAISLARQNYKVIAIDLDLGGANLHTTLGVDLPRQTLGDYFGHRVTDLQSCVIQTGIPNLSIISGAQDSIGISNLRYAQQLELLKQVRKLDADYIIFDLGAGTHLSTIHFFLFSDVGLVTLLPEPTSIENCYRFIKSAYYHFLYRSPEMNEVRSLIELAMDPKNPLGIKSPSDLLHEIQKTSPQAGAKLKHQLELFRPMLIVNQVRTQTDVDIGHSVKTVCKKYFGINMDYVGHLDYDSSVWQAVRKKRPLMLEFPNSRVVAGIEQMTQTIVRTRTPQGMVPPLFR